MYCICCNKSVYPVFYSGHGSDEMSIKKEESKLWPNDKDKYTDGENIVIDGTIQNINISFGSKFDMSDILIAICDECMSEKLDSGVLLYGNGSNSDDIEKSKQIYRRNKNLNELSE